MGTGFTVDSPLQVARYGISSVISLVDDVLIEQMRRHHCALAGEPYDPIGDREHDARARRISAYLDLLDRLVARQVGALQASPFEPGSEITRYYELLPETPLRRRYSKMLATDDPVERLRLQEPLRRSAVPGRIDVNIMTKLDRDAYQHREKLAPEFRDAMSALRGYALSGVASRLVLSAGLNPHLYSYAAQFDDFFPDESGDIRKEIVLKVSDYRSAAVQGKFLAKRGLWISEYRIESGLNCGGHAFPTKGLLMGPILEELKRSREALADELHAIYAKALASSGRPVPEEPIGARITVQGGIGTADEDALLLDHYEADATGWGTPFLLVPEATRVDPEHLAKLSSATADDVYLSDASPLGIPFWNLRTSASEEARRKRIEEGKPGSRCPKSYAVLDTEFTDVPICFAARAFQKLKLRQLQERDLPEDRRERLRARILAKSCICHDLAGSATRSLDIDADATPAVCPGPGIQDFSRIAGLDEMVGHIYGRLSLVTNRDRPHMFVREASLFLAHLCDEDERISSGLSSNKPKYLLELRENLLSGLEYYRGIAPRLAEDQQKRFLDGLDRIRSELEALSFVSTADSSLAV
jgi:hypothetical protein